jgi:hypothetical protein
MLTEMGGLQIVLINGVLNVGGDFGFHHDVDLQYAMLTGEVNAGHDVYITDNLSLPTAQADALAGQVHHPGLTFVSGNAP